MAGLLHNGVDMGFANSPLPFDIKRNTICNVELSKV